MIADVLSLTRWEWFKLRHRWMPWILLAITAALVQVNFWVTYTLFRNGSEVSVGEGGGSSDVTVSTSDQFLEMFAFPTSLANGLIAGRGFGAILVMILAASLIGSEYGWGALRTVLTKGTGRWRLLASKLLLLTGVSAGALIVATAALGVSSVIALTTLDSNWVAASADWTGLGIGFGKAVYGMLPYVALAVFAAVVTSSTGAAIGISLGYYFAESILLGVLMQFDWFERIDVFILGQAVSGWMESSAGGMSFGQASLPDATQSFFVLTGYMVVLSGAAFWLFQRREVAGAKGE